jgi:hypothetical protein
MSITPTVGRVVHYYTPSYDPSGPHAAVIAKVNSDGTLNLGFFHPDGNCRGVQNVPLVQDEEAPAVGHYAVWMPFQKGQAQKTEALEKQLADKDTEKALAEPDQAPKQAIAKRRL